jgi:hypothetical protein
MSQFWAKMYPKTDILMSVQELVKPCTENFGSILVVCPYNICKHNLTQNSRSPADALWEGGPPAVDASRHGVARGSPTAGAFNCCRPPLGFMHECGSLDACLDVQVRPSLVLASQVLVFSFFLLHVRTRVYGMCESIVGRIWVVMTKMA